MSEHIDGHNRIVVTTEPGGKLRVDCYRREAWSNEWIPAYGGIHPIATFFNSTTDKEAK